MSHIQIRVDGVGGNVTLVKKCPGCRGENITVVITDVAIFTINITTECFSIFSDGCGDAENVARPWVDFQELHLDTVNGSDVMSTSALVSGNCR